MLAALAAVGAALSPARPTGLRPADVVWTALLAVAVTYAASRAPRLPLVWLAGVAAAMGVGGPAIAMVTGGLALALGLVLAVANRRDRVLGAALGALAVQAVLWCDPFGFVGLPSLVAAAGVVPVLVTGWSNLRSRQRRQVALGVVALAVVCFLFAAGAGVAALSARSQLESAGSSSEQGLDQLVDGNTDAAATSFGLGSVDFARASDSLDAWYGLPGRLVPVVGQHLDALQQVSDAGRRLDDSAAVTASTAQWQQLTAEGGVVDLARVTAMQDPVAESAAALADAQAVVADVRSPWLLPLVTDQLDRLDDKLDEAAPQAALAAAGLEVAPALLGADGPTRYLLALGTPAESRNGGGFVGAWSILTADGGQLTLADNDTNLGLQTRTLADPYQLEYPPDWEARYSSYEVELFPGNTSASPDWPTDADVFTQIAAQNPDMGPVDGAIYVDPTALAAVLKLTGPVRVESLDRRFSADDVEQFLYVDQYVEFQGDNDDRKELLGDVARAAFDALTSRDLPGVRRIADVLGPMVSGGHLAVATPGDDDTTDFLDRLGLSGRFDPEPGRDFVSLRSANMQPNKIDAFLHRSWDVDATFDPESGQVTSTVTVTLRNDAPAEGLPDYVIGGNRGQPEGTNVDLLALYSPLALDSVTLDGTGTGVSTQTELGANVYSLPVTIGPGQSRTVVFSLAGPIAPSRDYVLDLLPQGLVNDDEVTVRFRRAGEDGPGRSLFEGPLATEQRLTQVVVAG